MSGKSPVSLLNFFIFNSTLGSKEGEEAKKTLFYYPESTNEDTQMKNVGLCEALIKFTETFNPKKPCQALHTQKTRQLFFLPEPNFCIVMTLSVPSQQKTKDGHTYIEYLADEIQDHVYRSVLKAAYKMFRLFMGTFTDIVERSGGDYENLKQRLEHFFKTYLATLKPNHVDLLDVFQGMHFLPLERSAFLKTKCFINLVEASFSQVKYTCFLYSDRLVWSGLEQKDMQVLYKYLNNNLIPTYLEADLQPATDSPSKGGQYARFVTGPTNLNDGTVRRVPKIYLFAEKKETCYLVIYRALSATLCLLVDTSCGTTLEFFKQLDSLMGSQMINLASEIGEHYEKLGNTGSDANKYLYMYFNHTNLAQKTTIHHGIKKTGSTGVSSEIMKILADFNIDLANVKESGEVIGKTVNDCWVVGKYCDQREFYIVLPLKNATIVEVADEINRLKATQFQNIFILE